MTTPAGACFGCGGHFEAALLEAVGDTVFCRACLGRLLRRVDVASSAKGTPAAPAAVPARTSPADPPCFVCGEPLDGDAFVELRGFAICARCSRSLVGEGQGEDEDPPARGAAPADDEAAPVDDEADDDDPPAPVRATPGTGTEWCSGCGRAMPGPGSYQLVDGRPTCAACVAARPAPPRGRRSSSSASAGTKPPPAAAPDACDACRRAVAPGELRATRGFHLCAACLESDPELALALAQARHRRRLERAGRRLLGGGDDD